MKHIVHLFVFTFSSSSSSESPFTIYSSPLIPLFASLQRYKQLLFFATKLDVLPPEEHTSENKVKGCVSQVWVSPQLKDDGKIYWRADSDSQLTKGLAALLVQGLSGCTAEEIVRIQPDFIAMLGLQQSLTPSRNNGFLNMFKLMQGKALEIYLQQQKEAAGGGASASSSAAASDAAGTSSQADGSQSSAAAAGATTSGRESNTPVADSMRRKLESELQPLKLDIQDDSSKHAGHGGYKGNANYSGETHFMVEVVSEKFQGLSSLKRHRLVYQIIDEEMGSPVHALSLITKTPTEAGMA
jgi:sulfur transfer protein SufE/stress-induced morphogen